MCISFMLLNTTKKERTQMTLINSETPSPQGETLAKAKSKAL